MRFFLFFLFISSMTVKASELCLSVGDGRVNELTSQVEKVFEPVEAQKVKFWAEARSIPELQALKNCILYTTCSTLEEKIIMTGAKYELHLEGKMTAEDLNQVYEKCPQSQLPEAIKVQDQVSSAWKDSEELNRSYRADKQNILLQKIPEATYDQFKTSVKSKLRAQDFASAVKEVLETFNLDQFGYQIEVNTGKGSASTTNHQLKLIKISKNQAHDPEKLLHGIRHELEHAHQISHADKCLAQGKTSDFIDHTKRERSAYLNDILNAPTICNGRKSCIRNIETTGSINFDRYLSIIYDY